MSEMISEGIDAFVYSCDGEPAVVYDVEQFCVAVALSGKDVHFACHFDFVLWMFGYYLVHHVPTPHEFAIHIVAGHAVVCGVEVLPKLCQVHCLMA